MHQHAGERQFVGPEVVCRRMESGEESVIFSGHGKKSCERREAQGPRKEVERGSARVSGVQSKRDDSPLASCIRNRRRHSRGVRIGADSQGQACDDVALLTRSLSSLFFGSLARDREGTDSSCLYSATPARMPPALFQPLERSHLCALIFCFPSSGR